MDIDEDSWFELDEQLTITDGAEGAAARQALFAKLGSPGSPPTGLLPLEEVQVGLSRLLLDADEAVLESLIPSIADIRPAIGRAFYAAQKLAPSHTSNSTERDCVGRNQFHALLVYLRYYFELLAYFQRSDTSEDMEVSRTEVMSTVPMLVDWDIDMVQIIRMWPRDKSEMKFNDFADWCLQQRLQDGYAFDKDELENEQESPMRPPSRKKSRELLEQHDAPCNHDDENIIAAKQRRRSWAALISIAPEATTARSRLFKQTATTGSVGLSLTEARNTLPEDWDAGLTDPAPPVQFAFNTSRELAPSGGRADCINPKQFHIFLTYLHYYFELLGLLNTNDTSEEAQVSRDQCLEIMPALMEQDWNVQAMDYMKIVPKGSGTLLPGSMSLHEFADWCLRRRLEGCAFDELDADAELAKQQQQSEQQDPPQQQEQPQQQEEQLQEEIGTDGQCGASMDLVEAESRKVATPKQTPTGASQASPVRSPVQRPSPVSSNLEHSPAAKASPVRSPVQRQSPANSSLERSPAAKGPPHGVSNMNSTVNKRFRASSSSTSTGFSTVGDRPERRTFLTAMSHVRSLPSITFGRRGPTAAPNVVPGPGSYPSHDGDRHSKYSVAPQYNFGGGGSRFGLGPPISDIKPGPGAYKPKDQRYHASTQVGFGSAAARGRPNAVRQWSPGPGTHDFKTFISAGPMYSQRGRPRPGGRSSSALPGPGAYHPSATHTEREAQKVGFGTSAREDFVAKHETAGPGPGAYSLTSFKGIGMDAGNKFSIKSRRCVHDLEPYMMPGPGMYDSHATSFGYPHLDRSLM